MNIPAGSRAEINSYLPSDNKINIKKNFYVVFSGTLNRIL